MTKRLYIIVCLLMMFVEMNGQTSNQLIREGNRLFSSKKYAQSEILYRKAVDKDVNNAIANYNLGRSLQEQKKNAEAKKFYEAAAKLEKDPIRQSSSYNNLGTIFQNEKDYTKAIEAYKNALRHNPNHNNARYNLELCKQKQKQQKQKQQSSNDKKNKSNKDKDKKKQSQNKNQKNNQKKNNQQKDKQDMSKENAEQLLNAVKQQEKETQERLSKAMRQPSDRKLDKNW